MTTHDSTARLMDVAVEGLLSKDELAELLPPGLRGEFLGRCADVERDLTRACAAQGDFCLASGCALEGESCLNAILKAGPEFNKACGSLWVLLFQSSKHAA